jgi:Flp pilus assembly protein TadD
MYCNSRRSKAAILVLGSVLTLGVSTRAQNSVSSVAPAASVTILDSTKAQDGLVGSVRRVKIQSAKLEFKAGRLMEGPGQVLEITTYNPRGNRIENVSYPVASSPVGKQEYRYDDKGNIVEMTLRGDDGSIFSREAYDYEFDRFGNWTKMVTNLVVFEDGELKHEPVEVTYRTLTYYFDDAIAKIVDLPSHSAVLPIPESIEPIVPSGNGLEIGSNTLTGREVSASSLEGIGAPPELPNPPETEKTAKPTPLEGEGDTKASMVPDKPLAISSSAASAKAAEVATADPPRNDTAPSDIPTSTKALDYYKAGQERFASDDLKGAVEAYEQSIHWESQSAEVHLSLGLAYLNLKNDDDAVKAFKQALRLNPQLAEAHYGLGLVYFRLHRNKDAADAFKQATLLRPDMAKAHYGLALTYQDLGKQDALIQEYRTLEILDHGLARKLSNTFPEFDLPCRVPPFCK